MLDPRQGHIPAESSPAGQTVPGTGLRHPVKMRRTHSQGQSDVYPTCGLPFIPKRTWQRFCQIACRRQHHRRDTRNAILQGLIDTARALDASRPGSW